MDFEEQLEKAEKLLSPSLVGSSIRSADDSAHQNYIHPEKYSGRSKSKSKKSKSILNSSLGASLDDLINEGALLGSDENFEKYLDDNGQVKSDAQYERDAQAEANSTETDEQDEPTDKSTTVPSSQEASSSDKAKETSSMEKKEPEVALQADLEPSVSVVSTTDDAEKHPTGSIYGSGNYSTPNLSEYQLDHQISDHSELLNSVKSYDPKKLPSSFDRERSKTNAPHHDQVKSTKDAGLSPESNSTRDKAAPAESSASLDIGDNKARVIGSDSLHAPYFQRHERSPSRSRLQFRNDTDRSTSRSRSRSRSAAQPHLARGDTYKNIHPETPLKYELPADLQVDEVASDQEQDQDKGESDEDDGRATRQTRPTMSESIAKAEATKNQEAFNEFHGESITRDPSLVTTGDYTNFNVDSPAKRPEDISLFNTRSESSRNYLRSISRSKSRQPNPQSRDSSALNEKNDADPETLAEEGALVSDDPYDQVSGLSGMVDKVLKTLSKPNEETIDEVNADDTAQSQDDANSTELGKSDLVEKPNDVLAEEKESEASEQAVANDAPTVSAKDIKNIDKAETGAEKEEATSVGPQETDTLAEIQVGQEAQETKGDNDVESGEAKDLPAEEKMKETSEQIVHSEAPLVTASDIHVPHQDTKSGGDSKADVSEQTSEENLNEVDEPSTESSDVLNDKHADASPEKEVATEKKETAEEEEAKEKEEATVETKTQDLDTEEIATDDKSTLPEEAAGENEEIDEAETEPLNLTSKSPKALEVPNLISEVDEDDKEREKEDIEAMEASGEEDTESSDASKQKTEQTSETQILHDVQEAGSKETADSARDAQTESEPQATKELATESKDDTANESKEVAADGPVSDKSGAGLGKSTEGEDEELEVSPEELRKHLESMPIYIFTSLAGGMKIVQRTNRLATILQANDIKFEARDLGTDEEAKKIWRRYANGKTLPGIVRGDDVIGNWQEIDEINEDYRIREVLFETLW